MATCDLWSITGRMTTFEAQISYSPGGPWLTVAVALTRRAALAAADGARHSPDPWNRLPVNVRVIGVDSRTCGRAIPRVS
jgi:hypothetical protein